MILVAFVLVLLALPLLACAGYLFWLALMARAVPVPTYGEPRTKFDMFVVAHDQESTIAETIQRLRALDYPDRLVRLLVIADACSDRTAEVAEQSGALVLRQVDPEKGGGGHALAMAFELALRDGIADAMLLLDADADVSPNLLRAFAARFDAGAHCVQAECRVRDADESPRSRLMVIVFALFRSLRSLARERLRFSVRSATIGLAVSRSILQDVPVDAYSFQRDGEYGVRVGLAGYRVWYAHEAWVTVQPSEIDDQLEVAKAHLRPLARYATRKKDSVLWDLAFDMAIPPITVLLLATFFGWFVSVAWAAEHTALPAYVWGLALYFVTFYVIRGWALSGIGMRGLGGLAYAPVYMVKRIGQILRPTTGRRGS